MTLPSVLVWIGTALAVLGLIGLGVCVFRALAVRRGYRGDGKEVLQKLLALNMASVGIGFIGLAMVIVGVIL